LGAKKKYPWLKYIASTYGPRNRLNKAVSAAAKFSGDREKKRSGSATTANRCKPINKLAIKRAVPDQAKPDDVTPADETLDDVTTPCIARKSLSDLGGPFEDWRPAEFLIRLVFNAVWLLTKVVRKIGLLPRTHSTVNKNGLAMNVFG